MKRSIKNILRLTGAFLPLFLTASLTVFLVLLCLSMSVSCKNELEAVKESFIATLTVTQKPKGDEEPSTVTLDKKILDALKNNPYISEIRYVGRRFYVNIGNICSDKMYESMMTALESGDEVPSPPIQYEENLAGAYPALVTIAASVGCTSIDEVPAALGYDKSEVKITLADGKSFYDGIIISKKFYEIYGEPDSMIFGWSIVNGTAPILSDGEYVSMSSGVAGYIDTLMSMPPPPELKIPVVGYYEIAEDMMPYIISSIEVWDSIYNAMDYYRENRFDGYPETFYRYTELKASEKMGFTRAYAVIDSSENVGKAIGELSDAGIKSSRYTVTSDDYDYKFARSQLESIQSFADISLYASVVFGILIVTLLLFYSVKKRSGEVYTMRTLGYGRGKIIFSIGCEVAFVLLLAVTFGILFSYLSGDAICGAINNYTENSVKGTVSNLSEVSELMQNSEERKAQISGAANAFIENGFGVSYSVPNEIYAVIYTAWACFAALSMLLVGKLTLRSLMKRG